MKVWYERDVSKNSIYKKEKLIWFGYITICVAVFRINFIIYWSFV